MLQSRGLGTLSSAMMSILDLAQGWLGHYYTFSFYLFITL